MTNDTDHQTGHINIPIVVMKADRETLHHTYCLVHFCLFVSSETSDLLISRSFLVTLEILSYNLSSSYVEMFKFVPLPIMPLSLLSRVDVGLQSLVAPVVLGGGRVEHGLLAGGEAVLLVKVEQGLIL